MSLEVKKKDFGSFFFFFFVFCFLIVTQLLLGFLSYNLETVTGNSFMDEDWRNASGILMCMEICDGARAGICAPSTCSSFYMYYLQHI